MRNDSMSGCISTVFRTILCRKLLSTALSEHDKYTEFCLSEKAKCSLDESIATKASGTPNLMAKLMGLDSIPIGSLQKDLSSVTSTVTSSRPMNSAESWKGFEATQSRPRRTKSFRETPSFLELEDENFFILSFENGRKNRNFSSKGTKSVKGFTETRKLREGGGKFLGESKKINENRRRSKMSKRESVYEKNKENMIVQLNCIQRGYIILRDKSNVKDQKGTNDFGKKSKLWEPLRKKKCSVEGRTRIKKRKDDCLIAKAVETSINSQNTSPKSVLEDVQLPVNGNANCLELSSRLTGSKLRRTLWEELQNYRKRSSISNDQEAKESKEKGDNSSKITDIKSKFHAKILKSNCKLAEEEVLKSIWMLKDGWKFEDYVKVGENLEAGILDQMIDELIDQLTDV